MPNHYGSLASHNSPVTSFLESEASEDASFHFSSGLLNRAANEPHDSFGQRE